MNSKSHAYPKMDISLADLRLRLFVHSFIQRIFIEHLLETRTCARDWSCKGNKIPGPCPYGDYILVHCNNTSGEHSFHVVTVVSTTSFSDHWTKNCTTPYLVLFYISLLLIFQSLHAKTYPLWGCFMMFIAESQAPRTTSSTQQACWSIWAIITNYHWLSIL